MIYTTQYVKYNCLVTGSVLPEASLLWSKHVAVALGFIYCLIKCFDYNVGQIDTGASGLLR
jgi:hypothetical protein